MSAVRLWSFLAIVCLSNQSVTQDVRLCNQSVTRDVSLCNQSVTQNINAQALEEYQTCVGFFSFEIDVQGIITKRMCKTDETLWDIVDGLSSTRCEYVAGHVPQGEDGQQTGLALIVWMPDGANAGIRQVYRDSIDNVKDALNISRHIITDDTTRGQLRLVNLLRDYRLQTDMEKRRKRRKWW